MKTGRPEGLSPQDPRVIKQLHALVDQIYPGSSGTAVESKIAMELINTALKALHSGLPPYEMRILSRAIRELRFAFKLFQDYKGISKASIFGSARTGKTHPEYLQAKKLAQELVKREFMVITGAGPGIMEAGNEGAGRDKSFGINIKLPFEQEPNPVVNGSPRNIDCHFFFTRKLLFIKETNAVICCPGGFGTLDEGFEILTLIQTGKTTMLPIIFLDAPGGTFWKAWFSFVKDQVLTRRLISEEDLHLFKVTDSVNEAVREVTGFYHNYHSMRFIGATLVLRLKRILDEKTLADLNAEFKDICLEGKMTLEKASKIEEATEPELNTLPRLAFIFKRAHCGRLRQLINRLNAL